MIIAYITEAITYIDDAPDEAAYLQTLLTICEGKVLFADTTHTHTHWIWLRYRHLDLFGNRKSTSYAANCNNQGDCRGCSWCCQDYADCRGLFMCASMCPKRSFWHLPHKSKVETYGSMDGHEKADFILEQVRNDSAFWHQINLLVWSCSNSDLLLFCCPNWYSDYHFFALNQVL